MIFWIFAFLTLLIIERKNTFLKFIIKSNKISYNVILYKYNKTKENNNKKLLNFQQGHPYSIFPILILFTETI